MPAERYADVNEEVRREWKEESDGFERVKDVLLTTSSITSVADIADKALVSEPAARKYLERLDELGPADSFPSTRGVMYKKSDEYYTLRRISELSEKYSKSELWEKKEEMEDELHRFSDEYQRKYPSRVESPPEAELEPGEEHFEKMDRWRMVLENYYIVRSLIEYKRSRSNF